MTWAIETFALTKRFPSYRFRLFALPQDSLAALAVDHVNLRVQTGEVFGLVGPNGAGKTTLIKLLCTLIVPSSGSARVDGYELESERAIKRSVGLVTSDERSFFWRLSGRQNLDFFATLHGLSSATARRRVQQVVSQVGLDEIADRPFRTYSTGQRQRMAIARGLLAEPRILFLDEPTKGLDPIATQQLHDLVRRKLAGDHGITIFLTSHVLAEVQQLCNRIAIMQRGRLLACGSLPELRRSLGFADACRVHLRGLGASSRDSLKQRFPDLEIVQLDEESSQIEFDGADQEEKLNQVIDVVRADGARIQTVTREPISLDAIFMRITAGGNLGRIDLPSEGGLAIEPREPDRAPEPAEPAAGDKQQHSNLAWLASAWRIPVAFFMRDLRQESSYRFSFYLQFFMIFLIAGMMYFVTQFLGQAVTPLLQPYGGNFFSFILIGVALLGYQTVGLTGFSDSLRDSQVTGTLEAMLTSPTRVSTIVLSSSLWRYFMTTFRVLVYLAAGAALFGVNLGQANYLAAVLVLGLTITALSGIGILAASFLMVLKRGDPVLGFFNGASVFLGGVFYPTTVLPAPLQLLSGFLPITYSLRALRLALLQGAPFAALWQDLGALALFSLILLPLSLVAFRFAVGRAKIDGSLTHY